jgi:Flp pilus assembly pilin Flp
MKLYSFLGSRAGTTNIEYALVATGIGIAVVLLAFSIGSALVGFFGSVESGLRIGG